MGLRYEPAQVAAIIERVHAMLYGIHGIEESTVYQEILRTGEAKGIAQGRASEAREVLLHLGRRRFGPPSADAEARIATMAELDRLHELHDRVLDVASWDELLAPPEL